MAQVANVPQLFCRGRFLGTCAEFDDPRFGGLAEKAARLRARVDAAEAEAVAEAAEVAEPDAQSSTSTMDQDLVANLAS